MRGWILGLMIFWTLVGLAAYQATGAEPVCITKDAIMARVQRDISPRAVGALMKPEQTAAFSAATGFPYPKEVHDFLVVVTPAIIGVFALDAGGCALDKSGAAAANEDDPIVMITDPATLRRLMLPAGVSL